MANSNRSVRHSCIILDLAANLTKRQNRETHEHKAEAPPGRHCLQEMHLLLLMLSISLCLILNAGGAAEQERDAADSRQGSC